MHKEPENWSDKRCTKPVPVQWGQMRLQLSNNVCSWTKRSILQGTNVTFRSCCWPSMVATPSEPQLSGSGTSTVLSHTNWRIHTVLSNCTNSFTTDPVGWKGIKLCCNTSPFGWRGQRVTLLSNMANAKRINGGAYWLIIRSGLMFYDIITINII